MHCFGLLVLVSGWWFRYSHSTRMSNSLHDELESFVFLCLHLLIIALLLTRLHPSFVSLNKHFLQVSCSAFPVDSAPLLTTGLSFPSHPSVFEQTTMARTIQSELTPSAHEIGKGLPLTTRYTLADRKQSKAPTRPERTPDELEAGEALILLSRGYGDPPAGPRQNMQTQNDLGSYQMRNNRGVPSNAYPRARQGRLVICKVALYIVVIPLETTIDNLLDRGTPHRFLRRRFFLHPP